MHPVLKSLVELQKEDSHLLDLRAQLNSFPRRFAELDARLAAARGEVDKAKAAQLTAVKERKRFELDVEQWKERVRKYKDQSAEVKSNEAYKALLHEIETAEKQMASSEDRLLAEMVAAEEYDQQIKAAEKNLVSATTEIKSEREKAEHEQAELQKQAATVEARRKHLIAQIPEDKLDHYIRVGKRHGGVAMSVVRDMGADQMCSMCGVRLLPHVFEDLRKTESDEFVHCETCTRILYFIEPQTSAQPPSVNSNAESATASDSSTSHS